MRDRHPPPRAPAHPRARHAPWAPWYRTLPAWGVGRSAQAEPMGEGGTQMLALGPDFPAPPHQVPEMQ